eukprot:CAMPEP_0117585614 /NCGR_PEP_ID=MMETSP0784-20121206/68244_1 /TAXON_ID=39447 /ORGANISM="" /LENGTH=101 /DNA_ID=CAMNT_0005386583 /DNA_START=35 /DNA_END=341 /DNA_ORIENTATION=-
MARGRDGNRCAERSGGLLAAGHEAAEVGFVAHTREKRPDHQRTECLLGDVPELAGPARACQRDQLVADEAANRPRRSQCSAARAEVGEGHVATDAGQQEND